MMLTFLWILNITLIVALLILYRIHQVRLKKIRRLAAEQQSACTALNQDLDLAQAAKYELLTYIRNEIRTPLNAVIGLSDVLLESELGRFQRKYLEMINKSGAVLLDLLNGILDLHQMETGSLERVDKPFNLGEVIENIQMIYGPQARDKGLELIGEISPDLPMVLVGDDLRLRQILVNLVTNAIRFTYKGKVIIRVAADKQYADQLEVLFSVLDTGVPVPVEEQQQIFNGSIDEQNGFIRRQAGAGLGLAITAGLVQLMDGRIWVETPAEPGCIFYFSIPFRTATRAEAYAFVVETAREVDMEEDHGPQLRDLEILIAEDNVFNQTMIAAYLEKQGARISLARDGIDAVKACRIKRFDAILMDVHMPGLDGLEATRRIRNEPGSQPTIIGLGTCTAAEDWRKAINAGMDDCQNKPIRPRKLVETILRLIHKSRKA